MNADVKVPCLAVGLAAGADGIDDMGILRHGAMETLFGGVRLPEAGSEVLPKCYRGGRLVEEASEVADTITTVSMIRAAALSPRAYSGGQGGDCVGVGARPAGQMAVRDSKDQAGPVLQDLCGAYRTGGRHSDPVAA